MTGPGLAGNEPSAAGSVDVRAEIVRAMAAAPGSGPAGATAMTSDLSIDEELILHSIGWEPVELVHGVSVHSIPGGAWTWGQGEITSASNALARSFAAATERIGAQCTKAGGHGVVGVHLERTVNQHHVEIALVGTAVRPVGSARPAGDAVFVSDLSGRDFALLHSSGWMPMGLVAGASFVYAPRRSIGATMKQQTQNVELTNFTEAMYAARESAMERMQQAALSLRATGVVEVKITEGPMPFARHAVAFMAYGTAVHLQAESHRHLGARMILPMDDPVSQFDPSSLRKE